MPDTHTNGISIRVLHPPGIKEAIDEQLAIRRPRDKAVEVADEYVARMHLRLSGHHVHISQDEMRAALRIIRGLAELLRLV
jgi:hypothetical protein